jgi:predicted ester cyclase
MGSPDENRQRVIQAVERFNAGDLEAYLGGYADDAVIHGLPPGVEPSRAGFRQFLEALQAGLPDLRVTIEDSVAEGDRVAVRMTYRGTHHGELLGVEPTGRQIEWDGLTIRRFRPDGLTIERWIRNDIASLLRQLGLS